MQGRCLHIFNFVSGSTRRGLDTAFSLIVYTCKGSTSARSFNPESDDEDCDQPEARNDGESSNQSGTESEQKKDVQPPLAKKKCATSKQRVWSEINRWHRIYSTDADFLIFFRRELDELNSSSGLLHIPGSHKDSKK